MTTKKWLARCATIFYAVGFTFVSAWFVDFVVPLLRRYDPGWPSVLFAHACYQVLPHGRVWDGKFDIGSKEVVIRSIHDDVYQLIVPINSGTLRRRGWGSWPVSYSLWIALRTDENSEDFDYGTSWDNDFKRIPGGAPCDFRASRMREWLEIDALSFVRDFRYHQAAIGMRGFFLQAMIASLGTWFVCIAVVGKTWLRTRTYAYCLSRWIVISITTWNVSVVVAEYMRDTVWLGFKFMERQYYYGAAFPTTKQLLKPISYGIVYTSGMEIAAMYWGWVLTQLTTVAFVSSFWMRRESIQRALACGLCPSCSYPLSPTMPLCPECGTSVSATTTRPRIRLFRWPPDTKRGRIIRRSIIALWWSFILFLIFAPLTFAWVCRFLWWVVGDEITKYPLP